MKPSNLHDVGVGTSPATSASPSGQVFRQVCGRVDAADYLIRTRELTQDVLPTARPRRLTRISSPGSRSRFDSRRALTRRQLRNRRRRARGCATRRYFSTRSQKSTIRARASLRGVRATGITGELVDRERRVVSLFAVLMANVTRCRSASQLPWSSLM